MKTRSFQILAVLNLLAATAACGAAEPSVLPGQTPAPVEAESPALVGNLSLVATWRDTTYGASGTTLARLVNEREWQGIASVPNRVLALAPGPKALAAGGQDFLWLQPRGKNAAPKLLEAKGDWVTLAPFGESWCAVSSQGDLAVFSQDGIQSRISLGAGVHPNDVAEIWNQWWVVGHKHGQSLVLTATTPTGPWTEAPTGGRSPVMRIVGFDHVLIAFEADGAAFRAVEGGGWEPSRGWAQLSAEPPTSVFAATEEGFIALTPSGLLQSRDGMAWVRLAYQDDPYGSRALLHDERGTVLISQQWTAAGLQLRREPVTPFSTFQLAQAFANGDGVPLDPKRALELYRKAAVAGVHRAQVDLAFLIASGQVPAASATEASAWYLLLCGEEGEACAPEEAYRRIEQLALKGRAEAQGVLAVLLRLGFGTKPNSVEATAWTQLAEEREANLYALDWYADPDDDPTAAKARAEALRATVGRTGSTALKRKPVSGTGD
ncbi:tetratricopeptide repeat protein [Nibricoccus sp. IMCC34717]|uniref:tetratricopeptide repeat protein n=1 Tax=Nibricoccus sp. IMCC34717 TaxID=3034021 RepID=UPI00384E1D71